MSYTIFISILVKMLISPTLNKYYLCHFNLILVCRCMFILKLCKKILITILGTISI